MEITEVRVYLRNEPKIKAVCNVTFDNCFVVKGIKVVEGKNGYIVGMPSFKGRNGQYRDIAHPINSEMRKKMEEAVLNSYKEELEKQTKPSGIPQTPGD